MKHIRYAAYIARHKWFVFVAGCRLGIPLLALMHDNSKFRPSEWFPYANFFYGPKVVQMRDSSGYYKPTDTGSAAFDFAWLLHQKRNKHHWQWWVLPEDEGGLKVLPMPDKYRREMLADWIGAGRAQGTPGVLGWYQRNFHKMRLHPETREWIETQIGYRVEVAVEQARSHDADSSGRPPRGGGSFVSSGRSRIHRVDSAVDRLLRQRRDVQRLSDALGSRRLQLESTAWDSPRTTGRLPSDMPRSRPAWFIWLAGHLVS